MLLTLHHLDEDNHVPHRFEEDYIRAALAELLVVREADLKQLGGFLQLAHLAFQTSHCTISLHTPHTHDCPDAENYKPTLS